MAIEVVESLEEHLESRRSEDFLQGINGYDVRETGSIPYLGFDLAVLTTLRGLGIISSIGEW